MTDITITTNLDPMWNRQLTGASGSNLKPCYGGGVWLIPVDTGSGDSSKIWRSMDGVRWEQITLPYAGDWVKCLWLPGPDLFVLIEGNNNPSNRYLTSPNGLFWTARVLPVGSYWYCSDVVNGRVFLAERQAALQLTSFDGINWAQTNDTMSQLQRIGTVWAPDKGLYYCFADSSSNCATSPDAVTWTTHAGSGNAQNAVVPVYGNGVFVGGGASAAYSVNGLDWALGKDVANLTLDGTYNLEWDATAGQFVTLVVSRVAIYTSYNGAFWKPSTKPWTGPLPNWLAAAQTRPQQFVSTATVGGNQSNYGNPSRISGKLFVPHNFTKLIQVSS